MLCFRPQFQHENDLTASTQSCPIDESKKSKILKSRNPINFDSWEDFAFYFNRFSNQNQQV